LSQEHSERVSAQVYGEHFHPNWFLKAVECGGVDLEKLTAALPREVYTEGKTPQAHNPDYMSRIFAECSRQTGDLHFGLHMVDYAPLARTALRDFTLTPCFWYLARAR